jgi:pyrroline-5-carboxylate reductase
VDEAKTHPLTIGFIGAGQMAMALAKGFVTAGLVEGRGILAADPVTSAIERFTQAIPGSRRAGSNPAVVDGSNIIFLAVKPQTLPEVMPELRSGLTGGNRFVSIAAGVRLETLRQGLGTDRVIRVMPNTPCLVGQGAAAYCLGPGATQEDGDRMGRLLRSVGVAFQLDEKLLDAVTGLSGSGPAFIYQVIEALSDGGVRVGLPRAVAQSLACQTVRGAAEMVLETGEHPAVLKDRVASPGGTTIEGLSKLEQGGLRAALISAVEAATRRSQRLGQ